MQRFWPRQIHFAPSGARTFCCRLFYKHLALWGEEMGRVGHGFDLENSFTCLPFDAILAVRKTENQI